MGISTIATAYMYFEKLVLKRIVEKANRRFVAAICVLLASKINERKGFSFSYVISSTFVKVVDVE
ncbi:hypothetical protein HMI56_003700 [Coelomomyces lativittatus]|nr:hypothetical protein HMI56_003700 [Coelomomyces lativittatus]